MEVLTPEEVAPSGRGTAVTVGLYDGVHLGHRRLLEMLRRGADELGLRTAVVTFDRHPATVVRPQAVPRLLTDLDQRLELLSECGVDLAVVVRFDESRAKEDAADFVDEVLVGSLGARLVVVGQNFRFGHERRGDVALLERIGSRAGFEVEGVALITGVQDADSPESPERGVVSSTRIRQLIAEGDVARAAVLLARPHELRGEVVHGDGRGGAELGFATANVALSSQAAVPRLGIYAGLGRRADGSTYPAAISMGVRPTFFSGSSGDTAPPAQDPLLEAHFMDFDGDLYGERIGVAFVERLRDERRFETVTALIDQMHEDVARARAIVGS